MTNSAYYITVVACVNVNMQWGLDNWHGYDEISTWKQYLATNCAIGDHINHVGHTSRRIFELGNARLAESRKYVNHFCWN